MGGRNDPFRATLLVSFKRQREFHFDPERTPYACGPTAVEEVPVLPVPWCLCVCVPVCPFVPVSICLWVCAGGCPKTPLVSVRPFTSVLCENYNLTGERALFSRCTEWGLGAGAGAGGSGLPSFQL